MLRRLLLILLGVTSLGNVSSQTVDLKAICSAKECVGQDLIERFTGTNKLTFLSGDSSCHTVDIGVRPNASLRYSIYGDKNYTNEFKDGCFKPVHSTVLKELFLPVQNCSDLLINVECKKSSEDVFLISKQNPGSCLAAGLEEIGERFLYWTDMGTLDQCGEQKKTGAWQSVKHWVSGAWETVKGWF